MIIYIVKIEKLYTIWKLYFGGYITDFKEFQELPIYKFLVTFLKNFKEIWIGTDIYSPQNTRLMIYKWIKQSIWMYEIGANQCYDAIISLISNLITYTYMLWCSQKIIQFDPFYVLCFYWYICKQYIWLIQIIQIYRECIV